MEQELERKRRDWQLLRFFFGYLKRYPAHLAFTVLVILLASLTNVALPYLFKLGIDTYIVPGNFQGIQLVAFLILGFAGLSFVLGWGRALISNSLGQKLMWSMRTDLMNHLLSLSLRFYNQNPVGKIITRLTNDIQNLNELLTAGISALVADVGMLLGILVVMFLMDWRLTLITLLFIVPVAFMLQYLGIKMRMIFRKVRKIVAEMNIYLQENLAGFQIIKAFNREGKNREEFRQINQRYLEENLKAFRLRTLFYPSINFLKQFSRAVILLYGGWALYQGYSTMGVLVAFFLYLDMFFEPIADFSDKYSIFQTAFASLEKILDFFEEDDREYRGGRTRISIQGEVEFKKVSFSYNGTPVLKDVSFKVLPGESLAIVGPTGAGKTTIFNLLLGFYWDYQGEILIDGVELRSLDLQALRERVSLVLQDVTLFRDSVLNNITLWEKDLERARESAHFANAFFVEELPEKYETMLAPNGANLSAGQRQLLSFARAIYRHPSILLLDEATSNIDSDTEKLIQEALGRIMQGRTSLVIAHRLSTIRNADKILVLEGGEVAEEGDHDSLMEKRGLYYLLYTSQAASLEMAGGDNP
ncbi:MAG: ABC transporter ATP-binding protein/permease [Caldiserica bacterium]|jgi:ATP-binding cassette subfamily B protein|nr:ABC transporter ATP-binding protein/permease [Caldisericota bacterium]MDH7562049.1 ABC transporter ATP-binding protein [Caldisericota bacterium]